MAGGDAPVRPLRVQRLGQMPYLEALELQRELVGRRAAGEIDDQLLLLEHDEVVTLGRGASRQDAPPGIALVEVERGGEATYHGPGQRVGYPILGLDEGERDLHRYLRNLEEVLIRALADLGVAAGRRPPHTGVWIGSGKVASIGVAVRRWVTFHGFALNVAPDLARFGGFRPCGLDPGVMTSLERVLGRAPDPAAVEAAVIARFCEVFGRELA